MTTQQEPSSPPDRAHRYYVTYIASAGNAQVHGSTEVNMRFPIRGWDDVQVLRRVISDPQPHLHGIVILNWIKFKDDPS